MQAMAKSYLLYFKPCGLLAAAGWHGASSNDYNQFWHPRFCVCVPQKLVDLLFPFLHNLKEVRNRAPPEGYDSGAPLCAFFELVHALIFPLINDDRLRQNNLDSQTVKSLGKDVTKKHEERRSGNGLPSGGCGARRMGGCGGVPRQPGPCTAARVPMLCVSPAAQSVRMCGDFV